RWSPAGARRELQPPVPPREKTRSRNGRSPAREGMQARIALATALVLAGSSTSAFAADDVQTDVRAAIAPSGEQVRLTVTSGGKQPGITLAAGKAKPVKLHAGEGVGTLKVGHGKTVVAFSVDG